MVDETRLREKISTITTKSLFPDECKRNYMKNEELKINQVFCFKIMENVYAYGSVLNSSLTNCEHDWYNGALVIVIYDFFTKNINLEEFAKTNKIILIEPMITKLSFFRKGILIPLDFYFKLDISYGFYKNKFNIKTKVFERVNKVYNEYGKKIRSKKRYLSIYAITTDIGLFQEMFSKIIDNKKLNISGENKFDEFAKFILSR